MQTPSQLEIEAVLSDVLTAVTDAEYGAFDPTKRLDSYGLDSVGRVGLLVELERRLGRPLTLDELVECETPRDIARRVFEAARQTSDSRRRTG